MVARRTPLTLLLVGFVGTFAIRRREVSAFAEEVISNDEFYANDDWGTMQVVGASASSFFGNDDNQLEYEPQGDFRVYGLSTETEQAKDYLPDDDRPESQTTQNEIEVDPADWDVTVDSNSDDIGVSGLAFVRKGLKEEIWDASSKDWEGQSDSLDPLISHKLGLTNIAQDNDVEYSAEDGLDSIEHGEADDDLFLDSNLHEYDLADDYKDIPDHTSADGQGTEELDRDLYSESVMRAADPLTGIEVTGQAVLKADDEIHDNYLLEIEEVKGVGSMFSSGIADEVLVTGQSVKVQDDEHDTESDDANDSSYTDDLIVHEADRQEQGNVDKLFAESIAALGI